MVQQETRGWQINPIAARRLHSIFMPGTAGDIFFHAWIGFGDLCVWKKVSAQFYLFGFFFFKVLAIIRQQAQSPNKFLVFMPEQQTQMTAVQMVMLKDLLSLVQPKNGIIADHYILLHIWTCTKEMTHLVRCQTTRKLFNWRQLSRSVGRCCVNKIFHLYIIL